MALERDIENCEDNRWFRIMFTGCYSIYEAEPSGSAT
jgi:hypothetical protein